MIAARIDGLERPERSAAERASVVGRVFERGAVATLSPATERDTLSGRLLALTRKQLILPDGSGLDGNAAFRFRHVLIRDAATTASPRPSGPSFTSGSPLGWNASPATAAPSTWRSCASPRLRRGITSRMGNLIGQAGEELARAVC